MHPTKHLELDLVLENGYKMKRYLSNHNYKKEERIEIISNTANLEHLKNILGGDFNINNPNKFKFENVNFYAPNYLETEKFGILFHMKGGSSLIMSILEKLELVTTPSTRDTTWPKLFKSLLQIDNKDIQSEDYPELIKILNGKSKKDLIIVTRNPIYKWLSGVYQEMEGEFAASRTLKYYIKQKNSNEDTSEISIDKLSDEAFEEVCYTLLKSVFESGEGIFWAHALLYNEAYYNFLELNPNIDKTKLKIIDIDSPNGDLITLLSSYYPEILSLDKSSRFTSHRLQHQRILNVLNKRIFKSNEKALHKDIIKEIQNQYYYYLLLQHKYGKYFIEK